MYVAARVLLILRQKRGYKDFHHSAVVKYDAMIGFLVIGWGLHYFPFYLMGRQLFLHHYFPALYFSILSCAGLFDLLTSTMSPRRRIQIAAVVMAIAIWTFAHFSPIVYGNPWTKKHCNDAKWLKTWDFSCNDYHEDVSDLSFPLIPSIVTDGTLQYAKYKYTWTPPASITHATSTASAHASNPVGGVNKGKIEAKPDVLTSGQSEIREKLEPGRDVFEAHPVDDINRSLEGVLTLTGANAPLDPGARKSLEEELKKKEQAIKAAQSEMQHLKEEVGPLLPSDLAKVEEERKKGQEDVKEQEDTSLGVGEKMIAEGKKMKEKLEQLKQAAQEKETESVDPTAVDPIQTPSNEKRALDEVD